MFVLNVRSKDGNIIKFPLNSVKRCLTLKDLLHDTSNIDLDDLTGDEEADEVPLSFPESCLRLIIDYDEMHKDDPYPTSATTQSNESSEYNTLKPHDSTLSSEDTAFFTAVMKRSIPELFELMQAANYLNNTDLLENSCKFVANQVKSKTEEELCAMFYVKSDK